jgi:hypothetical protein
MLQSKALLRNVTIGRGPRLAELEELIQAGWGDCSGRQRVAAVAEDINPLDPAEPDTLRIGVTKDGN